MKEREVLKLSGRMRVIPLHDDDEAHIRANRIARKIDPIFRKVRSDPQLGKGSFSHVDEAMSDEELISYLSDLEEDLGPTFSWTNVRKILMDDEKDLWDRVGVSWPIST